VVSATAVHARAPLREAGLARPRAATWGQPGKTVGRVRAVQVGRIGTVPLGRKRIWPIDLCFVFIFSEYIQILANFKNLCRIHLNSESCETNFV
jgi:hypothetical protein